MIVVGLLCSGCCRYNISAAMFERGEWNRIEDWVFAVGRGLVPSSSASSRASTNRR